jgi:DNA-binding NarL/FixJ family response regulator
VTRVFVVARSPVVRAGLDAMLRRHQLDVAGSSQTLEPALDVDVLLVDWDPAGEDVPAGPSPAMVLLVDTATSDLFSGSVRGLLPKGASEEEIVAAVEAAAAGLFAVHTEFADLFSSPRPTTAPRERSGQVLTPREIEVLRMMAEGLGNKTIAWKLGISEHTVKFHITSIFGKLNAGTRTEAVTAGIRQGLVLL